MSPFAFAFWTLVAFAILVFRLWEYPDDLDPDDSATGAAPV